VFYTLIEGWTLVDSFYFSVTTLTTVGFGDPAPTTDLGKIFTVFFILSGVGMLLAVINALGKQAVQQPGVRPLRRRGGPGDAPAGETGSGAGNEDDSR
jgi:hypothetical protein